MLQIYRSNLVEALLGLLARRLGEAPLASPFTPELVVAPSPAMARWVHLGLAKAQGIAANLAYPLPASFVWQLARDLLGDLPEGDALALEPMAWRIYGVLPALLPDPAFAPLHHYLQPADNAIKRWQIAERIADAFDRYQLYRPDLMRAWSDPAGQVDGGQSAADAWQPILWRRLTEGVEHHRVAVIDRLLARLSAADPSPDLPERVSLFAISSLPPLLVEVIRALAVHTQVDLYLHSPTDQFWADLVDQKALARKRLERPEEADLWEVGHPLLASWGRQGQALQDMLLEGEAPINDVDGCAAPTPDCLLHRIQHDIFTLTGPAPDGSRVMIEPDTSIQVQICHSALRECQVLHDRLLEMFEAEPDLSPEDCLVMIPEIDAYAPYVEAVFERDPSGARPHIPWNLSDLSPRDEHPLILVFLQLLDLPSSRFGHAEILSYLDVPELAQTFGLDAEALAQVKGWLADAGLRWGLDAAHKARLGLPGVEENTWAQAEGRLFGGYAMADDTADWADAGDPPFADIVPIAGVEGTGAQTLGRFWHLLTSLRETAAGLTRARPAAAWQADLTAILATYFVAGDDEDGRVQRIRDALAELTEQASVMQARTGQGEGTGAHRGTTGGTPLRDPRDPAAVDAGEPLPLALVRHWLGERLGNTSRRGRYFRGGVTFCGMRPMRSLPFQVICVLGLNDAAFPRRDRPAEFDLMRRTWRPGDPRKGDEDRYLFLETLLCARRRLYLSYVGRELRGNAEHQPSVLLRELLDAIDQRYVQPPATGTGAQGPEDRPAPLSGTLTRIAPMHPFSPRNYLTDSPEGGTGPTSGPSFDAGWCGLAQAGLAAAVPGTRAASAAWPKVRLRDAPEALRQVGLAQLERWLRNPIRHFVNTRLQVYLREEAVEPDDEPFRLDALQHFQLKQRLVQGRLARLAGVAAEEAVAAGSLIPGVRALAARGALPHGALAGLTFDDALDEVNPLLDRLAPYQGLAPAQVLVDLAFDPGSGGPIGLIGQIPGLYPGKGLLRVRPAKLKGADILGLWLHHLAWCAMVPKRGGAERHSRLLCLDESFALSADLDQAQARVALGELLALYWEGIHRPLPILPRASFACARALVDDKDPRSTVKSIWEGNTFNSQAGEREDPYVQLVLRGREIDPLAVPEFTALALDLYGEVLRRETA